ncbi:DUF3040 domain-containing protein [Actinoplanes sp. L3-i22]|uniref:DUF3040 domain-containing protein n=1 Tax=Actinoplanes sp. L3-i22 TaxID=2836373 RepID=UPI001C75190C|nr:DUF3040 domain-containing protein [Actinoplanes sp. L3-i22]BCY08304.1 hypothetical protein L3i22_033920 [Actinoplanes sp. L3-i22]
MLEEKDRRVLADIEERLCAGDPAFARRMRSAPCPFPTLSVLCVVAFLSLPFLGLFLGPGAVLLAINVTAAVVILVLAFRGRRRWAGPGSQ